MTQTWPAAEEKVESSVEGAEEHSDGSSCLINKKEGKGAEDDNKEAEEKRDAFPEKQPLSPKATSNIPPISAALDHNPPRGSSITRTTFSPGSPTEKQTQLSALFSSLRLLRKGAVTPEHDTAAQIKPASQGAKKASFTEKQVQGSFLDQITQFLSREKKADGKEAKEEAEAEGEHVKTEEKNEESHEIPEKQEENTKNAEKENTEVSSEPTKNAEVSSEPAKNTEVSSEPAKNAEVSSEPAKNTEVSSEPAKNTEVSSEPTKPAMSSAEAAFDAFKAFFTPRPLKKESVEKEELEAVRKKIRTEKDSLRAFFERASIKNQEKKDPSDGKSEAPPPGEGEERTPGRLQTVWPPLKEEKVGLKYTEAEHQAALLQLKRECKEELERLQEDYGQKLSRKRVEKEECVARLESTLAELQAKLDQGGTHPRGELRDVCVSTADDVLHKSFRNVCIQTDRETFVKTSESGGGAGRANSPQQPKPTCKKLDLASIGLSLASQRDDTRSFSSPSALPSQALGSSLHTPEPPPAPPQTATPTNINHAPPPSAAPWLPSPPPVHFQESNDPPPLLLHPPPPGSPPPPPPLPGGGFMFHKPPRKLAVEPSRPMKPLYWNRIQIQENNNNTLWNILEEPNINTSEFEDLFAKATANTKRKLLSDACEKKTKSRKIKLLDGKRSQAVGILISSLHLEMKDIQQAVLTVDHSVVDLETIEALYENRAQPEELQRIKKHYETLAEDEVKLLDKPEQFLFELSQIPDFTGRAHCIIFQSTFTDGITSIQHKLRTLSSVCKGLLEGDGVKAVMGLVLALGNYMNGGSRARGQADGFDLEILPKLKDVKSRDSHISLVDYVVSYYLHNVDKNAGTDQSTFPLPEPPDVFLAAQVNFDDLNTDLIQLGQDLTRCEKDIQKVCSNSPEEHLQPFKDKMEAFVLSAQKEQAEASCQLMTAQKSFKDLVLYFGLKPRTGEKEVTASHFFLLWFEFCADFKVRWKRENKNISKERLKEAKMSVKRLTEDKKVETRRLNPNSLKERMRQKRSSLPVTQEL
uniref:formin n=1 Tax=Monopterus albus TaxID=43700 RepID=UPI0009B33356|nr:formin-like [Monopterus albus]